MSVKLVSIWCEWDIGQGSNVFIDEDAARKWCESNVLLKECMFEIRAKTIQAVIDQGLLTFNKVTLNG